MSGLDNGARRQGQGALVPHWRAMKTKIIEAGGNGMNWGKFLVGRFDSEWQRRSGEPEASALRTPLLAQVGWGREHLWVLDLQTGEGACYRPGGYAAADLEKHRVWVCPLYQPFLEWLYKQDLSDLDELPDYIELPAAPAALFGYRRPGPEGVDD